MPKGLIQEDAVEIPVEMMDNPVGFVIDAGISITKLIYRSKEEFAYGRVIKGEEKGLLRVCYYDVGCEGKLIKFIRRNCDLIFDETTPTKVFLTGVRSTLIKPRLEKDLDIRIEVISEMRALEFGLSNAQKLKLKCLKVSEEVYDSCRLALEVVVSETVWQQKQRIKSQADGTYEANRPNLLLIQGPAYEILFTQRPRDWMDQFLTHEGSPKGPALVLNIGANLIISMIDDKGNMEVLDFLEVGGKTLSGLARKILKVKKFEKLAQMADKGHAYRVNTSFGEIRTSDVKADDYYTNFHEKMIVFSLGNLASDNKLKKSYNKNDIAAGLIDNICTTISKMAFLNAKLQKVSTVYACGSLGRFEAVKKGIESHFMANAVSANILGLPFIRLFFIKHPGFVKAFGLWCYNVEKNMKDKRGVRSKFYI